MTSVILRAAAVLMSPLIGVLSIFMLLRGHNEPGGGFIGGLLMALAFVVGLLAHDVRAARALLRVDPRTLIGIGLLAAMLSGVPALAGGLPFMTGLWWPDAIPGVGKVSTVLLFDVGVLVVVWGMALLIMFTLSEE